MKKNQFLVSAEEELIDYSNNVIIPEYYFKSLLDFKRLKQYDDMAFSYRLSLSEKEYLYKLHYNIIETISKYYEIHYNLRLEKKILLLVYSYPVINYIFWLYEKYKKIEIANAKYDDLYIKFSSQKVGVICKTLSDVASLMENDDYNSFIYSEIARKFGIKIKYISIKNKTKTKIKTDIISYIKSFFNKIIKYNCFSIILNPEIRSIVVSHIINVFQIKTLVKFVPKNSEVLLIKSYIPYHLLKRIIKNAKGKIVNRDIYYFLQCENQLLKHKQYDSDLRDNLLNFFTPNNFFEELVKEHIKDTIPMISLECFNECYKYAEDFSYSWKNIRKFYSAGGLGCFDSSTIVNIIAGLLSSYDCRIIDIQHSAGYGVIKDLNEQEMIFFDEFVTWGWQEKNSKNIRPCRNIRFAFNNKYSISNKLFTKRKVLYVTDGIYKYNSVGKHCDDFVEKHIKLVELLPFDIRQMMTVRLRNNNYSLFEKYKNNFPEIEIEWITDSSFAQSISKRELVIVDSNGSPYYECIMKRIPTIMFEAYSFEKYTDSWTYFYDKMIKEKMLFDNPQECANEILNIVSNDFSFWSFNKKKLSDEIIDYYFNEKADFVDTWLDEFLCK